ncbi:type-F conjugative transfer system protein TraW [Candidatus Odyssella acanthamoebae]|uniref:type-F conjugative transfer system protein TraW n=1 Tax=Candidatus Odyssella acanthamoebae TaxID=91604 RepID=UPI00094B4C90|nr:type-F conjugative transfer system protein TraW [Candidatus Paracaedibacter acanthamoebae]
MSLISGLYAKDLGSFGTTFPIAEESLLEVIEKKLGHLSELGQLESHQQIVQDQMKHKALNPVAVKGISRATTSTTRFYDPSIKVPYDLKDHEGRIFQQAGTVINPLKTHALTKPLLFINGEDPEQVAWALSQHTRNPRAKLILVQGSPFKLAQENDFAVFFDQGGKLVKKLGITEVPTLVTQNDDKLQIDTLALEQEANHD